MVYEGKLKTTVYMWPIPIILFVSKSEINDQAIVYALHFTPWFEIGYNRRLKKKV